jgi:hypothetical protein
MPSSYYRARRVAPFILAPAVLLLAGPGPGTAAEPPSKEAQIEEALSAAPPAIRATAKVMDEKGTVLREGSGRYTCFPTPEAMRAIGPAPMCGDEVWIAFNQAVGSKKPFETDRVGVAYMLAGETGSNIDPYAMAPTEQNHWVVEGPHVMIIAPDPAHLTGLPTTPQPQGAYVMFPGTSYAHIMIPVADRPAQPAAGQ